MAEIEYRGQYPLDVTVVPARAVYLVREDSRDGFRRAVQEASTRWAGMTEPIVPVQEDGTVEDWARHVVKLARVDGAVDVDLPDEQARTVAAALGLDCVRIQDIDRWGITATTCHPSRVGPPTPPGQSLVIAGPPGELWQVVAAGDLPAEHLADMDRGVLSVRPGTGPDDVARAQLNDTTLLRRTLASFGETIGSQAPLPTSTVLWVTEPDDLRDCWDFWNARALAPVRFGVMPMILLPRNEVQHWLKFDTQFEHILRRRAEFNPDVLLTSTNVPDTDLDQIASLLHLERTDDNIRRGLNFSAAIRTPPFTYRIVPNVGPLVSFTRVYGVSTQVDIHVFDSSTTTRFASPVTFRGGSTLMRFGGVPFRDLPRRSVIAKLVDQNASWREDAIQIGMMAMEQYAFQLHIPSLQRATYALLADATIRYEPSQKGRIATGIQRSIDLAALRQPNLFKVVRQLTTRRKDKFITEVKKQFKGHDQIDEIVEGLTPLAEEWAARIERKMATAYNLNKGATPENVAALEQLCDLGWAERGLRIKCTDCGRDTFIPLNDVAPRGFATCHGCGSQQNYARGNSEISIFYRLDSLVDLASDQGIIPHLITIAELNRREPQSWLLPGVDLWFADRENKLEADIFGVYGGRLVAGEVKTSGSKFTDDQIAKDINICQRLRADLYVMSATDTIAGKAQSTAKRLCADTGLDLLVLTSTDLMPDG
ncbi:MAG: hypothetical protein ACRDRL_10565 [Sciscionella sp.]